MPATSRRLRRIRELSLRQSLASGMYPKFYGTEGPTERLDPREHTALDYLQQLWPTHLCALLADQTNRYALQRGVSRWQPVTAGEIWTFLGVILLMGVHVLPRFESYWSRDSLLGIPSLSRCMSRARFRQLLRHLHLYDEASCDDAAKEDRFYKVRPIVRTLQKTFLLGYNPSQEFSVDEMMIKCKGRAKGKVYMPKKPIKRGFKVWSLSCSCCGYLCNFQLYAGNCTGKRETGLATRVVLDLVEPFTGYDHVLYLDNFFSSMELALELIKRGVSIVGTVKADSRGLPEPLKGKIKLAKGDYVCITVGEINCFAYHDRKVVRFITNVFPPTMPALVPVRQSSGLLIEKHVPPLLPAYNKYMGAVDRTGQLRKYYGIDRKCRRPWLRIFFHLFDLAVNNAHILYKHSCKGYSLKPKDLLAFRMELVHIFLDDARTPRKRSLSLVPESTSDQGRCLLVRVCDAGMKRGRCFYCQTNREKSKQRHTRYCCRRCRVRLCKVGCYDAYHRL